MVRIIICLVSVANIAILLFESKLFRLFFMKSSFFLFYLSRDIFRTEMCISFVTLEVTL